MSVDRFSHSYHNMDVTNMKLLDHAGSSTYRNGSGQMSRVLRMSDGRKVVIHNAETRTTGGPKGFISSILLSGFIDAAFQLYGDWVSGLCLSPNQYFWRANVALWLGLATGMVGAAVVVAAIAAGAPALAAGLVGFTVTSLIGYGLYRTGVRDNLIKKVSDGAGRY